MHNLSYKSLFIILLFLLIPIIFLLRINQRPKSVLADWFNDSWSYRQAINISSHSVGETNVYIATSVNIGTTTKSQPDNGDFRFTTSSGQLLDYYISANAGTTAPIFHIKFDSFPIGAQTVYAYYGNPSASNGFSATDFSTLASSYVVGSPAAEELGGGPVAWWKFDEGLGLPKDSSQNAINTTANTGIWASQDQCISGKCMSYNNTQSSLGYDPKLNITSNVSYNVWFKLTGINASWPVMMGRNPHVSYGLRRNANNYSVFFEWGTGACAGTTYTNYGLGEITDQKWHMFSMTQDSVNMKLYLDGKIATTIALSSFCSEVSSSFYLGNTMTGFLDEAKIYQYPRSATQIKQDYTSGLAGQSASSGSSVNLGSNLSKGLADGLIGHYKFDEGVGTTTIDSSGTGSTATFGIGTSAPGWSAGKFGIGLSFDGTQYEYTSIGTTAIGSSFTLSSWINPSSLANSYQVVFGANQGVNTIICSVNNAGELLFRTSSASAFTDLLSTGAGIVVNNWYFVTFTYDGYSRKVYVNGVLKGQDTTTNWVSNISTATIGLRRGIDLPFFGLIDDTRIYNRALSLSEINSLYSFSPGPLAYYNFEEGVGTSAIDTSGSNINTAWAGPSNHYAPGKFGKAAFLGTTGDFASISNSNLDMGNNDFTISTWIKTSTTARNFIIDKGAGSGANGYRFETGTDFKLLAIIGSSLAYTQVTGTKAINDGIWHYITVVFNRSSTAQIYVDGIKSGTPADISSHKNLPVTSTSNFYIGSANSTLRFNGLMDEIKIYNYARTQEQIIQDMQGSTSANPSLAKPIGYWKFDENFGSTAYNSSTVGSTLNAILGNGNSSPTWVSGKINKALQFNGTTNYLQANLLPSISRTSDYSFSAWIYKIGTSDGTIIQNSPSSSDRNTLYYTNGTVRVGYFDGASWYGKSGPIPVNIWTHVVGTNKGGSLQLYINGIEQSGTSTPYASFGSNLYIGKVDIDNRAMFQGMIDEVKIYNYALSSDEIKTDYNSGASSKVGQSSQSIGTTTNSLDYCLPGDTTSCLSPIAEWKFEEGVGTTTYDTSGNGNNAGFGSVGPIWTSGKIGKSFTFDSSSSQLNAGSASTLDNLPATGMSLSAWVYPLSRGENNVAFILAKNSGFNPSAGWYFRLASTYALNFSVDGATDLVRVSTDNAIIQNKWNHVEISWDGNIATATSAHIYVNGVEVTYATTTNGATRVDDNTSNFYIGNDSGQVRTFDGKIDQVRVYNYARTPAQVAYDYNKGAPIGWWKLDECQGNISYDSSGIGRTGTISIGASGNQTSLGTCAIGTGTSSAWTNGAVGKNNSSLYFDGIDDTLSIGTSNTINPLVGSVSLWTKPSSTQPSTNYFIFDHFATNSRIYINTNSTGNNLNARLSTGTEICNSTTTANSWHHIIITWDNTTAACYIDGQNKTTTSTITAMTSNGAISYIGNYSSANQGFAGQIDDVQLYNYALNSTQIKSLYNGGSLNFR